MENAPSKAAPTAFLPNAERHNPDPGYLTHLLAKTGLSQRGSARLIGLEERAWRNFLAHKSTLPYAVQYCLEVLARSGVDEPPKDTGVWFDTKQRPLRESDAGRLIWAKCDGQLVAAVVRKDGFGVTLEPVAQNSTGRHALGANTVSQYVLIDAPPDGGQASEGNR